MFTEEQQQADSRLMGLLSKKKKNYYSVLSKSAFEKERLLRYILWTLEPYKSYKWTVIVDRSLTSEPSLGLLKWLCPILQKHYPETLTRLMVYPTSTTFWMLFQSCKLFLDPQTYAKVLLRDSRMYLLEIVEQEQVPTEDIMTPVEETLDKGTWLRKKASLSELQVEEIWSAPDL